MMMNDKIPDTGLELTAINLGEIEEVILLISPYYNIIDETTIWLCKVFECECDGSAYIICNFY